MKADQIEDMAGYHGIPTLINQDFNMITVGPYAALAGTGLNTIRRASVKYGGLGPCSIIQMTYVLPENFDADGNPTKIEAVESLIVNSMVLMRFSDMMKNEDILSRNHCGLHWTQESQYRELFQKFYPDLKDDDMFVAVYF